MVTFTHTIVNSTGLHARPAALLPFYSHLFGLCLGGGGKVRRVEGRMAGTQAYPEMSALP